MLTDQYAITIWATYRELLVGLISPLSSGEDCRLIALIFVTADWLVTLWCRGREITDHRSQTSLACHPLTSSCKCTIREAAGGVGRSTVRSSVQVPHLCSLPNVLSLLKGVRDFQVRERKRERERGRERELSLSTRVRERATFII